MKERQALLVGSGVLKKSAVNVESRPPTEIICHPLNTAFRTPFGPKLNPLNSPVETVLKLSVH